MFRTVAIFLSLQTDKTGLNQAAADLRTLQSNQIQDIETQKVRVSATTVEPHNNTMYSRTSVAQTLMARLPRLFRTLS